MKKLFTSLLPALLFILGAGSTWAQTSAYERTEKRLSTEELTSGKLVTIQARDTNNSGFFSGASPLPSSFQQDGSTVYRIKKEGNKFIFQQVSSSHYLQASGRDGESIRFAAEETNVARMTITRAMDVSGKRKPYKETLIAETVLNDLYRIVDDSGRDLNCENTATTPTWTKNRHGGFTYFYIWEVKQVEVVSFTYTYKLAGVPLENLNQSVKVKLGSSIPQPNVPRGLNKGNGYTTTLVGDVATSDHDQKTYEVDIKLPFVPQESFPKTTEEEQNVQYYCTFAIRETDKFVTWDADAKQDAVHGYFVNRKSTAVRPIDEQLFLFVGNQTEGFRIYNRAKKLPLGGDKTRNRSLLIPTQEESQDVGVFVLDIGEKNGKRGFVLREKSTSKVYFHDMDSRLSYWVPQRGEDSKNDEGSFVFFNKVDVKDAPGLLALDKKLTIEAFEKVKGKYTSFSLPIDALIGEVNQLTATNLQELSNCRLQIQKYQKVLNEVVAFYSAWGRLKKSEEVLGVHETELGKLNSAKYQEAKKMYEALMEKSSVTFAELEEYQLANKVIADAVLNSPTDGMLLQIQPDFHATTTDSRIVGSTQKVSVMVLRTEATELNSIFYFKSGQLICLGTGTSLKASGTQIQTGYYESGDPVEFGTTGLYKYNVKVGNLYLKADANNGTGEGGATNAREVHDEEGWSHFILHKVTSIPVRIGSTGYATLCLPVAVQVAEGYEAFAAKKKDGADYLELIPLTGVIPAGTAFIVKGAPSTDTKASICQLTVKTEQGSANAENVLKGFTDYSQQSTFTGTVYGLTKNTEGSAVFARLENGISPIPFRAFYTQTGNNAGVNELNLRIDSTLTGVQQLQQLGTPAPFFDLFGRRVQSPQKGGIYLQGGRKVVVQ